MRCIDPTILGIARAFVQDERALLDWYRTDGIAALDGLTAAQLVDRGQRADVIAFLQRIYELEKTGGARP